MSEASDNEPFEALLCSGPSEYHAPPVGHRGNGRLDAEDFPVMYASQDVEVCVHECRVTVEDQLYMATLAPVRDLRLLDLTAVLEEDVTHTF